MSAGAAARLHAEREGKRPHYRLNIRLTAKHYWNPHRALTQFITPAAHTIQKNSSYRTWLQSMTPPLTNCVQSGLVLERDRVLYHNEARTQLTTDITISFEKLEESLLPELLPHSQVSMHEIFF